MVTQLKCVVLGRSKSASRRSRRSSCRSLPTERRSSRFEVHRLNMEVATALGLSLNAARWWVRMKLRALGAFDGDGASGRIRFQPLK